MKAVLWVSGLLLTVVAYGEGLSQFEARISTPQDRDAIEMVLARNAAAASDILEGRYPQIKVLTLRRLEHPAGYEWYLARLSVRGDNVVDTALAKGSGDARRLFANRYAEGHIVSLGALPSTEGYMFFESAIHGASPKVFKDVVFAKGIADARKTFQARYPDARLSSIVEVR